MSSENRRQSMAENFPASISSSWQWSLSKSTFSGSSPTSGITDIGGYGWSATDTVDIQELFYEDPNSISGISFDVQQAPVPESVTGDGRTLIYSDISTEGFCLSSSPTSNWNQNLLSDNSSSSINFGLIYDESSSDWPEFASSYQNVGHGFSKNTPSWNYSFSEKPKGHNLSTKQLQFYAGEDGGADLTFKRPRIETPSPLPTFKVRKEKLGDRIAALQQLVSPFGKTDTASVLHEAIDYIKFLHEQVSVLSAPCMKNGASDLHQKEPEEATQDLRNRGLCLVPISTTFAGVLDGGVWINFQVKTTAEDWPDYRTEVRKK